MSETTTQHPSTPPPPPTLHTDEDAITTLPGQPFEQIEWMIEMRSLMSEVVSLRQQPRSGE